MLVLHDLVEVDAGDNPVFAEFDTDTVVAQEQAAARRIFGLLPDDIGSDLKAAWEEFEAAQTPSAQFAKSLDRFQPPMQNMASGGGAWDKYNVSVETITQRVGSKIAIGAPTLWDYARARISTFFTNR